MTEQAGGRQVETLVIGGGQSGLAVGYQLAQRGLPYAIIDANGRIGDAWRNRWDSLRLFTPNRLNALPGVSHAGYHWRFPSKDEMADYLESYAEHFGIPVQTGVRVERLSREGGRFVALAGSRRFEADNVVVAMSSWQRPRVPAFAGELDPGIVQLHVAEYRNPGQLQEGGVLVVGAGNSGAEIALEVARTHEAWLSGPETDHLPFRPELRGGADPHALRRTGHLPPRADDQHAHRAEGPAQDAVHRGAPGQGQAEGPGSRRGGACPPGHRGRARTAPARGGRRMEVANVVWCTGFRPGFSWIDLPVIEEGRSEPDHHRGVVEDMPGLYFVGLKFLYAVSSEQIHGVGRDAAHIAEAIAARREERPRVPPAGNREASLESV